MAYIAPYYIGVSMTKNQKTYCGWLKVFMIALVASVSFMVVCTNYGEPPLVEVPNNTK